MFAYLFATVVAKEKQMSYVILTEKSFQKLVLERPRHKVWMVMFTGSQCPACKHTLPKFINASDFSNGMVKFGTINIENYPKVAEKYEIKNIPHFIIFHSEGETVYNGERKVKSFLNTAASYIKSSAIPAREEWLGDMLANPSAIFFTDRQKVHPVWAGISSFYYGKSIRIGVTSDDDTIKAFDVKKIPCVMFYNGTHSTEYKGSFNFPKLRAAMDEFFAKKLVTIPTNSSDSLFPQDFEEQCLGGRSNCIISVSSKPSPLYLRMQKIYARHHMKWFFGTKGYPYSFIENSKGHYWIYNPRKDAFIDIPDEEELQSTLDLVLDGMGKWTKTSQLNSAKDL